MSYHSLADFLEELERAGELARVAAEVDPILEVAEITARSSRAAGPALLFGSLNGHRGSLLTNLLGTEGRIRRALGVESLGQVAERIAELASPPDAAGWFERLKSAPTRGALGRVLPRSVRNGPVQQVVRLGGDVDLGELPVPRFWPEEPRRTMTAAQVFSRDPETGGRFVGHCVLELQDRTRLAVCWPDDDPGALLLRRHAARREPMPVAVVLGGDPAMLLAAMSPLPVDIDACALAGLLRDKPVDLVACRTIPLEAPAEAEIVIEGAIDPAAPPCPAGPLCTPMGRYTHQRLAPVMEVAAITHRANPIFPAMVPSAPPHEACVIGQAIGQIFLPLLRLAIPELIDCSLPTCGAGRQIAFVSITKSHAGQARRVAQAVWSSRWLVRAKLLVVVDEDVDVHHDEQVWSAVAAAADLGRDVIVAEGPPDPFDPATPPGALGSRMAIDATAKLPGESSGEPPRRVRMSEEMTQRVTDRWAAYGLGDCPNFRSGKWDCPLQPPGTAKP